MGNATSGGDYHHHHHHHHDNNNDDTEEEDLDPFDGIPTLGYRVLGVQPNSPASKAGLVSFLDFLVGAEEKMLLGSGEDLQPGEEYDDVDLPALLAEYKGKELELLVWNIKSQQARLVKLIPDDTWGGAGLLGVTIRLDNYAGAEDRLVRVLSVQPKSPAAVAGLVPEKDFLLGTTHQTLESTQQLAAVLQEYQDHVVELYVYNTDSDIVRVVALMPTLSWGGGGLLGAEVGTGYLHRLPASARETEGQSVERKVRYVRTAPCGGGGGGGANVNNSSGSGGGGVDSSSSDNKSTGKSRTVLELEPQLEMEPSDHEDEGEEEEEAGKVKYPPAASQRATVSAQSAERQTEIPSSGGGRSGAGSSNTAAEHQAPRVKNEVSTSSSNGGSVVAKDVAQAQTLPQEITQQASGEESKVHVASATMNNTKRDETAEPAQNDKSTSVQRPAKEEANYVFSQQPPPRVYAPPAATTTTSSTSTAPVAAAAKSSLLPPPPQMHYDS